MKVEISLNENVKVFSVLEWMYIDLLVDDCGCDWIGMCCFDERRLKVNYNVCDTSFCSLA
jgi:hypothetical protein